jgi:hypothetical protein
MHELTGGGVFHSFVLSLSPSWQIGAVDTYKSVPNVMILRSSCWTGINNSTSIAATKYYNHNLHREAT